MEPLITFKDISVVYNAGQSSETNAVRGVSGEIYPGEYVIFFGPSGCGKSTLLYCLAGLEYPLEGTVTLRGKNIFTLSEQEKHGFHQSTIGMIFQAFNLVQTLTAYDNILLPILFKGATRRQGHERVMSLLKKFDIEKFSNRKPQQMSGGQQQRTAIARALINEPPILLADEPVGNLDSENKEIVMDMLSELNEKEKRTIVLVTHDPTHLVRAHRVFYIKDGKIERVVENKKREKADTIEKTNEDNELISQELAELYREFPFASDVAIAAKILFRALVFPYSREEQNKIEQVIGRYLSNEITEEEMIKVLDNPLTEDGAGLYIQTARDIATKVATARQHIENLQILKTQASREADQHTHSDKAVETARRYILDTYKGTLSLEQIRRFDYAIQKRITNEWNKTNFKEFLDKPLSKSGVGLNSRTARRFAKEIELLLIKLPTITNSNPDTLSTLVTDNDSKM